jgi:hypothetical protein
MTLARIRDRRTSVVKLAVKKDEGSVPGGGYHYMLCPFAMESDKHAALWELMGYIIIEVDAEAGDRLLAGAREALRHQMEVAYLVDGPNQKVVKMLADKPK